MYCWNLKKIKFWYIEYFDPHMFNVIGPMSHPNGAPSKETQNSYFFQI